MENFGLITIESSVLENLGEVLSSLQYGSTLISHEIAHHWTGDLVTMLSFDDLWLNEAFAEYFQYLPFINGPFSNLTTIDDIFYLNEYNLAFYAGTKKLFLTYTKLDTFSISHPIVPSEKNSFYFDDITYNKGAVALRLLHNLLDNNFSIVLKEYIHQFAYSSASTSDFLEIVKKYSSATLASNFERFWLRRIGFPLVTIEIVNNTMTLEQKNLICAECSLSPFPLKIQAKIFHGADSEPDLLETDFYAIRKSILFSSKESKIVLNVGMTGFYRVLYSPKDIFAHADILYLLSAPERSGYIDNLIEVLISGNMNISCLESMSLLSRALGFMKNEQDTSVWQAFAVSISRFEEAVRPLTEVHSKLLSWVNSLLNEHFDNDYLFAIHEIILHLALCFQNEAAIEKSLFLYNKKVYDPKLLYFVNEGVIRYHGKFLEIWESQEKHSLKDLIFFSATTNITEQQLLISAYSSTKELSIILEQISNWGHYKIAWDTWKTRPREIRIDLEKLSRQLMDTDYINEAMLYAPYSNDIKRGLERGKQVRNFGYFLTT